MTRSWKKQATSAYGLSLTQLALNAVMFAEELPEQYEYEMEFKNQINQEVLNVTEAFLEGRDILETVKSLRNRMEEKMHTVISYTDRFLVYEYALNRVERRFDTTKAEIQVSEQELLSMLIRYITGAEDYPTMNVRIQEVISQLPARLTKKKFYSMVKDALQCYVGGSKDTLDQMMYMLRMSGTAEALEEEAMVPDLDQMLSELKAVSFKEMDGETYKKSCVMTEKAGKVLQELSDYCSSMGEMFNSLYVLALTKEDAMRDVEKEDRAFQILNEFCTIFKERSTSGEEEWEEKLETLEEKLEALEGLQEEYYERYLRMDPVPEYQEGEDKELGLARCVDRLLSGSIFVKPDEILQEQKIVEEEDIEQAVEEYIACMDPVFASSQKPVIRAIMAGSLSILPVFFHSMEDIQEYIVNSLGSCSDPAEKATCMELLQQIVENGDYALV